MLSGHLVLPRCPHCSVARPTLIIARTTGEKLQTVTEDGIRRWWETYMCTFCRGVVLAASKAESGVVTEYYPPLPTLDTDIPEPARDYLRQAQESLAQPAGALMLCASSVDAMLKEKGLRKGTLNKRIDRAAKKHLITEGMAQWAHQVRFDANKPRHADEKASPATMEDAGRSVAFTLALAEFLFVLPTRVTRGIKDTKVTPGTGKLQTSSG